MSSAQDAKKVEVKEFVDLLQKYPVVGIVNMMGLPTPQVQSMREQLRDSVVIKMTKKTLARIILKMAEKNQPGIEKLSEYLKGMPAFILTKDNPFTLFKTLKKNKSTAPAKAGQEAPSDIVVPAGPTPFAPGPVIGELGAVGIKAGIDGGKVAIKEDSVVAKEGDKISADLAGLLARLGIEPMEIGLDLTAVFEGGQIFDKKVLDIDEDQYIADIGQGHTWAFNLAMNEGIFNETTTELLLVNASRDALGLAVETAVLTKDSVDQILAKAQAHGAAIQNIIG